MRCVTVGKREAGLIDKAYVDEGCVLLAEDTDNIKKQAMEFRDWCEKEKIDIVMAINSMAILSALPYLPRWIRIVSRCANAFDEGYRITMSGRDRLMRIVALTPRLLEDLTAKYGANSSMIELIPNGIDPTPFGQVNLEKGKNHKRSPKLQLGFLGRLEHKQKGVLYLPEIVRELKAHGVDFHLRIAGKGKHRPQLEKRLRPYIDSGDVELVGVISKDEVPGFLKSTDVFLFTSHFEGCPNALLEAMMAGCVPVTFLIDGITDFVLDHGRTGFIAPMGDCSAFAGYVAELMADRSNLENMSAAASAEARIRFTPKVAAAQYARMFNEVMDSPLPDYEPLPWSKFRVDPVYRRGWRSLVPRPIKAAVKQIFG